MQDGNDRKNYFQTGVLNSAIQPQSKFIVLSNIVGFPISQILYDTLSIDRLILKMKTDYGGTIEKLRIYFAAYDKNYPYPANGVSQPYKNAKDRTLLLFFCPVDATDSELNYYIISPDDSLVYYLPDSVARDWADYYLDMDVYGLNGLVTTIERNAKENYIGYPNFFSDTRCITYGFDSIINVLQNERKYQMDQNSKRVTGIEADLAAYTEKGINGLREGFSINAYKDRLIVQFEYLEKDSTGRSKIFYIDTLPDFNQRKILSGVSHPKQILSNDNGQLCPPNCPCPSPPCR